MNPDDVIYFGKTSIILVFYLSLPVIGGATIVGLIVALLQTLIQLQEQTLGFAVKLAAIVAIFFISGGWMMNELVMFQELILLEISGQR